MIVVKLTRLDRLYLAGLIERNEKRKGGIPFLRKVRGLSRAIGLKSIRRLSEQEIGALDADEEPQEFRLDRADFDFLYSEIHKLDAEAPEGASYMGLAADVLVPLWDQLCVLKADLTRKPANGEADAKAPEATP